jgi:Ni,Fe-hydrogenase III small subunit/NAD-dependent dihydropyrimidine dehydrogenase PreA subunit
MLPVCITRWKQGHRTIPYPSQEPTMPDRFRGLPVVDASKCPQGCRDCAEACPTRAITIDEEARAPGGERFRPGAWSLDLGRCLFCTDCMEACPDGAIRYSQDYRLATRRREDMLLHEGQTLKLAEALAAKSLALFGRSLKLRQVSAGGCGACEADLNVLNTVVFDLGRFGIQFVASPRHADGIIVTGAVSENMRTALLDTYAAVPAPKLVIAVGACAISGGPYVDNPEIHNGCASLVPVDLFIPGCPPHPMTILDGLLRLLGRVESKVNERNCDSPQRAE